MQAVTAGPSGFFELGGRLFFSTASPDSLDQGILWSTDGSSRGTVQVSASLCVAHCMEITPLATGNGLAWLRISTGVSASEVFYRLARTDGTAAGTYVVTGLLSNDPYFHPLEVHLLPGAAPAFFSACSGHCALWWSDGSRSGTGPFPGADGRPFYEPRSFTVWRNRLYFVASREAVGGEPGLWSTDGTVQGTRLVHALSDLGSNEPDPPVVATPSRLFFVSGPTNEDLWATDGTAEGSRLLADFPPVACESNCEVPDVYTLAAFGDEAYFETPKKDGQRARIWRSDGTLEGTRPVIDLPARIEAVENLRRIGGHWIFAGSIHEWDDPYPWTVDDGFTHAQPLGTCGGEPCPTVSDLFPTPLPGLGLLQGYASNSPGLWITDGTGPGTRRLPDLCGLLSVPQRWPGLRPGPGRPAPLPPGLSRRRRERRALGDRRHAPGDAPRGRALLRDRLPERPRLLRLQAPGPPHGGDLVGGRHPERGAEGRRAPPVPRGLGALVPAAREGHGLLHLPGERTGGALAERRHAGRHRPSLRIPRRPRVVHRRFHLPGGTPSRPSGSTARRSTTTDRRPSSGGPTARPAAPAS